MERLDPLFWFLAALPWIWFSGQIIDDEILLAYACWACAITMILMSVIRLASDNDVGGIIKRVRNRE